MNALLSGVGLSQRGVPDDEVTHDGHDITCLIRGLEPLIEAHVGPRLLNVLAAGFGSFRPDMLVIAALTNSRRAVFILPGWSLLTDSARPWLALLRHR
jgi:hypothetical protein